MTFKKPEMDKTLKNGLSMSETDPLNHKWLDFAISPVSIKTAVKGPFKMSANFHVF